VILANSFLCGYLAGLDFRVSRLDMGRAAVALPGAGPALPAWPFPGPGWPPARVPCQARRPRWARVLCLAGPVPLVGLGGGPQPGAVHEPVVVVQWTQELVIFSIWARVASGPSRNGDPSRTHSDLYSPMVCSARALS